MLKTGQRPGPSFGKSFYICGYSKNPAERCSFVKEASGIAALNCRRHDDCPMELRAMQFGDEHSADACPRIFYRCAVGKAEKKNWCGEIKSKSKDSNVKNDGMRSEKSTVETHQSSGCKDKTEKQSTSKGNERFENKCSGQNVINGDTKQVSNTKSNHHVAHSTKIEILSSTDPKVNAVKHDKDKYPKNVSPASSHQNGPKYNSSLSQPSKTPSFSDFVKKTNIEPNQKEQLNSSFQNYRETAPRKNKDESQDDRKYDKNDKSSDKNILHPKKHSLGKENINVKYAVLGLEMVIFGSLAF